MQVLAILVGLATRLLLRQFLRIAPEWLDHRTDDPVMHERINRGSDRYFAWRDHYAQNPEWDIKDPAEPLRLRLRNRKMRLRRPR